MNKRQRWIAGALLCIATAAAHAQWMWKDETGHTIASDQPPPPGTPASRILKAPRTKPASAGAPQPTAEAKPDAPKPAEAPKSLADRDLDAKQKQKEAAEAQKKSDDEAAKAKLMADNCSAARSNLAALQTGGRTARVNEKGERTFLDDNQRASEVAKAQGQIGQNCK